MIDLHLFYPQFFFKKDKHLFFLIKKNKNRCFKYYLNKIDFDIKSKKDIKLIKSLFIFSIKCNNSQSNIEIFKLITEKCKQYNSYNHLITYLLLKGTLYNSSLFGSYSKIIKNTYIDFYNTMGTNYQRKIYPAITKSYNLFMNHYQLIFNIFIENPTVNNIQNSFLLEKMIYPEGNCLHNFNNLATSLIKENSIKHVFYFFDLFDENYKYKRYYHNDLTYHALNMAFEYDNNAFCLDYLEKYNPQSINNSNYLFEKAIKNESKELIEFFFSTDKLLFNTFNKLIESKFFDSPYHIINIKNLDFLDFLLNKIKSLYNDFDLSNLLFNNTGEYQKEKISKISSILSKILNSHLHYNYRNEIHSDIYYKYISFDIMIIEDSKSLLKKYYLNNNIFNKLFILFEKMSDKNINKPELLLYINNLKTAKNINKF
jgi:hypothetical protein